jgi:predicted ArsR family transcriptional regulator
VFRCRYNLALRVKPSGAVKVDGGGPGTTLRPVPKGRRAISRRTERMADAIIERIERIGTSCVLDLVEERGRMSIADTAEALGVEEEIVRLEMLEAAHGVEIELKRAARNEHAAQREAAGELLYQIRSRKR